MHMTVDIIYKRIRYRICIIYIYCNIIPTAPNKALDAVSITIMSYNSPKRVLRKLHASVIP